MPSIASPAQPSLETVLDTLAQPRLLDLCNAWWPEAMI
jgi:hypothetical protein